MPRLPVPGQDDGTWGSVLNEYLSVEHNADGTQKNISQTKIINLTTDLAAKANTTDLTAHAADTTNIHGIADTAALETTTGAQTKVDTHTNDTSAAHAASSISYTPTGTTAAIDVQAAIDEVALEAAGASGTAGGVLSGTYPNPGFAVDMVEQGELDTHTSSSTAHGVTGVVVGTTNTQALTNKTLTQPIIQGSAVVALTDAPTITTDAALGNIFIVTLEGNRAIANPTNPTNGQKIIYRLTQDAIGTRTISWGAAFRFGVDVTAPVLSTAANLTDYVGFIYNSTATVWDSLAVSRGY